MAELGQQERGRENAKGFADDQSDDHAVGDRVQQRRAQTGPTAHRYTGGEEGEHRHREARRHRPHGVFEVFGGGPAVPAEHGHGEAE